jgi:hypothetical protein
MSEKPKAKNSESAKELEKAEKQFDAFDQNIKDLTVDRMNMSSKQDMEQQTKISQKDLEKSKDIYLKPKRTIGCRDKFNEDYRDQYNFDKQFVHFIAENKEIIGEAIDIWTRPYAGMPAEEWEIPVNTPVWGPRYLAEQLKRKFYHRLTMENRGSSGSDSAGQYFGTMVVDTTIQRLDAHPVSARKSIFMGANTF